MDDRETLVSYTVRIVEAHVGCQTVSGEDIPALLLSIHAALRQMDAIDQIPAPEPPAIKQLTGPAPVPAVPIDQSVHHDYLICLEDGKRLRMLKRYLRMRHGMTPEQYRRKWGLPTDYPMNAPALTKRRRDAAALSQLVKPHRSKRTSRKRGINRET